MKKYIFYQPDLPLVDPVKDSSQDRLCKSPPGQHENRFYKDRQEIENQGIKTQKFFQNMLEPDYSIQSSLEIPYNALNQIKDFIDRSFEFSDLLEDQQAVFGSEFYGKNKAEVQKKRTYAQELIRQIEEKNKIEDLQKDRRKNNEEKVRLASADRNKANLCTENNSQTSEKEIRDNKDPDARISQKRETNRETLHNRDSKNTNTPGPCSQKPNKPEKVFDCNRLTSLDLSIQGKNSKNSELIFETTKIQTSELNFVTEKINNSELNFVTEKISNSELNFETNKLNPPDYLVPVSQIRGAEAFSNFSRDREEKEGHKKMCLFNLNTLVIESYFKELQDVKLEIEKAKEQCLETNELVLREKEKGLELVLMVLINQTDNFYENPNVFAEEKRSFLGNKEAENLYEKDRNATSAYDQVQNQPVKPGCFHLNEKHSQKASKNELFEKSLISKSEFINPSTSDWAKPETIQIANKNKGNLEESRPEHPDFSKHFSEQKIGLIQIKKADESLPGNNTYLSLKNKDFFNEFESKYLRKLHEVQLKHCPATEVGQKIQIENTNKARKENLDKAPLPKILGLRSSSKGQHLENHTQENP